METVHALISQYGYLAIFGLLMLGILGLPVPDETLLTLSGYLAFKGDLQLVPTVAVAYAGTIAGITLSYALGRLADYTLIAKYGRFIHLTEERLSRARSWFERFGKWLLLFGYFLPGFRHVTAILAGVSKLRPAVFAGFAYIGAFCWSLTFLLLGYFLGKDWIKISSRVHSYLLVGSGLLVLSLAIYFLWRRKKPGKNTIFPSGD